MNLRDFRSQKERREFLEKKLSINLDNIAGAFCDDEKDIHCENLIGMTVIPLGVAGPVNGHYIPLATTEGALVASVNRGCRAIADGGGANVYAYRMGTTRGPVFYTGSLKKSKNFYIWLQKNIGKLAKIAESTSSHLKFIKYDVKTLSCYAFVRFYFNTGEAMGMNMVTIATAKMAEYIEKEKNVKCLSVAGNYDTDKKPAWINFISNRGFEAWGETIIPEKIIRSVLKTTPKKIFDVWLAKCMIGSAMAGSMGFNAHYANIVAAFFAATGQDLAHIVEGSMGITIAKVLDNGDLYFSVYLPAIMLGIVGGGTKLNTKQEALTITAAKNSEELAEILVSAVLAGELSLIASLSEGSLAKAHEKLGR